MTVISSLGREGWGIPLRIRGLRVGRYDVAKWYCEMHSDVVEFRRRVECTDTNMYIRL